MRLVRRIVIDFELHCRAGRNCLHHLHRVAVCSSAVMGNLNAEMLLTAHSARSVDRRLCSTRFSWKCERQLEHRGLHLLGCRECLRQSCGAPQHGSRPESGDHH